MHKSPFNLYGDMPCNEESNWDPSTVPVVGFGNSSQKSSHPLPPVGKITTFGIIQGESKPSLITKTCASACEPRKSCLLAASLLCLSSEKYTSSTTPSTGWLICSCS